MSYIHRPVWAKRSDESFLVHTGRNFVLRRLTSFSAGNTPAIASYRLVRRKQAAPEGSVPNRHSLNHALIDNF